MQQHGPTFMQKAAAWAVHLFTSSGLVAGFMAILAINEKDWRMAMIWLIVALVIDGIDGTFARMARTKEVLPEMDGKTIDYVIDFANYAIIPAYFFYESQLVEEALRLPLTAMILLVSALYYGKQGMISDDHFFIGFPVLWNVVVFYLVFVWPPIAWISTATVIFFCIIHFVPIKFLYPSQTARFSKVTIPVTVIMLITLIVIVFFYPDQKLWLSILANLCLAYFGCMAVYNTWIEKPVVAKG